MLGGIERECGDVIRFGGITDKASSGMGIQPEHEEESEMVSVPKCFKTLLPDLLVGGRIHEDHDQ